MGMFKGKYAHITFNGGSSTIDNNPDPYNFEVIQEQKIGNLWVSMIRYPNATNFEGKKVLVTDLQPSKRKHLDPHFAENGFVIARFPPTNEGIKDALLFTRSKIKEY